jgi:hypothetical protein
MLTLPEVAMKYFLAALCLVAFFAAGCKEDGDKYYITNQYYYPPDDSTGHHSSDSAVARILSPQWGQILETVYDWQDMESQYGTNCRWAFHVDTTFSARVVVDLPGGARTAQVYMKQSYSQNFTPYGNLRYPLADTFNIPLQYNWIRTSWYLPTDSTNLIFFVQGMAADSTNWITETVSVWISPRTSAAQHAAPDAPTIDTLMEDNDEAGLSLRWCHLSPFVDYTLVSRIADGESQPTIDSVSYVSTSYSFNEYYPSTRYTFRLYDGNSFGRSPVSESITITTHDMIPPSNLHGSSSSTGIVSLQWNNHFRLCDSLLVARRDTIGSWSTIKSIPVTLHDYPSSGCLDSTATRRNVYYYRVGVSLRSQTWWSADSLGLWVQ